MTIMIALMSTVNHRGPLSTAKPMREPKAGTSFQVRSWVLKRKGLPPFVRFAVSGRRSADRRSCLRWPERRYRRRAHHPRGGLGRSGRVNGKRLWKDTTDSLDECAARRRCIIRRFVWDGRISNVVGRWRAHVCVPTRSAAGTRTLRASAVLALLTLDERNSQKGTVDHSVIPPPRTNLRRGPGRSRDHQSGVVRFASFHTSAREWNDAPTGRSTYPASSRARSADHARDDVPSTARASACCPDVYIACSPRKTDSPSAYASSEAYAPTIPSIARV